MLLPHSVTRDILLSILQSTDSFLVSAVVNRRMNTTEEVARLWKSPLNLPTFLILPNYPHLELIIFWPLILQSHTRKTLNQIPPTLYSTSTQHKSIAQRKRDPSLFRDFSGFVSYSDVTFVPFICLQDTRHSFNHFRDTLRIW